VTRQSTDVGALVRDAVDAAAPRAADRKVAIDVKATLSQPVPPDRDRMWQVISDPVSNAIEF
jgi:signal transduction histidine kinase